MATAFATRLPSSSATTVQPHHTERDGFAPLRPRRPDYARAPISEGFDWGSCLADVGPGTWYLVVFRSVRRAGADAEMLTEFDDLAHREAQAVGGLHFYFKGEPDSQRACLSLCLWQDQLSARGALQLPRHQAAARIAAQMYESFGLERYSLTKHADGRLEFLGG